MGVILYPKKFFRIEKELTFFAIGYDSKKKFDKARNLDKDYLKLEKSLSMVPRKSLEKFWKFAILFFLGKLWENKILLEISSYAIQA